MIGKIFKNVEFEKLENADIDYEIFNCDEDGIELNFENESDLLKAIDILESN